MSRTCPHNLCDGSGFLYDEETNTARPCPCRPQRQAQARAKQLSATIPKHFRNFSFDRAPIATMDWPLLPEVKRYAADIDRHLDAGTGLWFQGNTGSGKTTLAMLVSKAALDAGRTVAIYSLPRLLAEIRMTFDQDAGDGYVRLLDRLTEVDLLHIDDVGAEKTSEWVLEQLYAIVNARYEAERAIMITTNLDVTALEEQISERTVSRLVGICGDPLMLYAAKDLRRPTDEEFNLPEPAAAPPFGRA